MTKTPFNKKELDEFEQLLLDKKTVILQELQKQSNQEISDEPGDLVDMATGLLEQEMNLTFSEVDRLSLIAIDEALERIKNKTFGICIDSGEVINKTRLRAVPEAKRTVVAQEKYDKMLKKKQMRNTTYKQQFNV